MGVFLLTEDIQCSVEMALKNKKIGYCGSAELYDEQPETFKQSWRQRERWAKGFLQVFKKDGKELTQKMFKRHSCWDMFSTIFPSIIIAFSFILGLIATLIITLSTDDLEVLSKMWKIVIGLFVYSYTPFFIIGLVTLLTEWKKIQVKPFKKIFYLFTFPLFMFTYVPISIVVFFKKVEWKPIEHKASFTLQEIENSSIVQNNITSADPVIEQDDEEVKEINI